jgi:aflatoxin B1 aldehyde reductase
MIPLAEIGYRWHSTPADGRSSPLAHLKSNVESVEKVLPERVVSALDIAYKIVGHDVPQYRR